MAKMLLTSGRTNQKARTREALVDAAIDLVRQGRELSIAEVADSARVSRATAYNYFPTVESLYAQAVLTFVTRDDYPDFYRLFATTDDVETRVRAVVETSDTSINLHERLYRGMLRVSLERGADVPRRPAYRPKWLADALEPLGTKLDRRTRRRLISALSLCIGIEAHVTLRDVCGLSPEEARRTKVFAAQALLSTALPHAKRKNTTA